MHTIAFVGLTHLGLISAVAALEKGFKVIAFDPNVLLIENLKKSIYPISEPGFEKSLSKYKENILFSSQAEDLKGVDVVYVSPDIPTNDLGQSELRGIYDLLKVISPYFQKIGCLVILSQVPPGFTRALSKIISAQHFDITKLYYQVETLVFGIALERALYPERFIIGMEDPKKPLYPPYEIFLKSFGCPILPMQYESAEFCKICINAFLAASVTTSNTLEDICQKIDAKWSEITPALRLDKRIGQYAYLSPGLGLSGGNIERDLRTILTFSNQKGTESTLIESFIKNSAYRKDWPLRIFHDKILPHVKKEDLKIGVLGLSYKENTHSIKNSPSIRLLSQLKGFSIKAYDPEVKEIPASLTSYVKIEPSIKDVILECNVLFIMTPWEDFKNILKEQVLENKNLRYVVDPYSILKEVKSSSNLTYYSFC